MKSRKLVGLYVGSAFLVLTGCNGIGNAPAGPSADQVQADFAKESPLKQIQGIEYSPIPAAEKEKRISDIEKKYGVSRNQVDASGQGGVNSPGAPQKG